MQIIAMQITVMPVAIKKIIFIAKVGSKTLPKSEVKRCQSRKFARLIGIQKQNKPRRSRGLWSQTWLRKRVLSAAQGAQKMERLTRDEIN